MHANHHPLPRTLVDASLAVLLLLGLLLGLASVHAMAGHALHETTHGHEFALESEAAAPTHAHIGDHAAAPADERGPVVPVVACTDCLMEPAAMIMAVCSALALAVGFLLRTRGATSWCLTRGARGAPRGPTPGARFHVFRVPLTVLSICRI